MFAETSEWLFEIFSGKYPEAVDGDIVCFRGCRLRVYRHVEFDVGGWEVVNYQVHGFLAQEFAAFCLSLVGIRQ